MANVKAKYNSTPPTVADQQWADLQVDSSGNLKVVGGTGSSSTTVQGTAADDAAFVGNPVLIGGEYEATPNTVEDGDVSNLKVDANGRLIVGGGAADDAAAVGNPVPVGGKYNAAPPTYSDGDRTQIQTGTRGAINVSLFSPDTMTGANVNTPTDAITNSTNALAVRAMNLVYNGTTWDRMRGDTASQLSRNLAYSASAAFTPAAASHTAGDVNGGAQEFALGAPSGINIKIVTASMIIAGGTIETTAWKLHLFNVTPPSALADDAAFTLASGDRASYLGFIDLAQVVDYGDTLYIEGNPNKQLKLSGTSVFGYLVNGTTLTPQAVAHTVTLNCVAA